MPSKRDRRNSGRYTPEATVPRKLLIKYDLEIPIVYDDWRDHRDGFRDWFKDFKLIKYTGDNPFRPGFRARMNRKQERLIKRRMARKLKFTLYNQ